jgi:hypothetical protein
MKQKFMSRYTVVVSAAAAIMIVFASVHLLGNAREKRRTTSSNPPVTTQLNLEYVRRARLRPDLCSFIGALGNRLEVPGKERVTITGSLKVNATNPVDVRLITEFPNRMRLEEYVLGQTRVIAFDGQQPWTNLGVLTPADMDLIESISFDSVDRFFIGQTNGLATRALGKRFRVDEGNNLGYSGPFYDIYEVTDRVSMASLLGSNLQSKVFYLNSDTLKLERIHYQMKRASIPIAVDVLTPNWQSVNGQLVPISIERQENGNSIWKFTGSSWTLGPRVNDGIFSKPAIP